MRTNIEIDDKLLRDAMVATGRSTKRATIEEALRTLVRLRDEIAMIRSLAHTEEGKNTRVAHVTRTNIEIDERLLTRAMQASKSPTKRGAVEQALWAVVQLYRQKLAIEDLRGIGWEGDLDAMREGWSSPPA